MFIGDYATSGQTIEVSDCVFNTKYTGTGAPLKTYAIVANNSQAANSVIKLDGCVITYEPVMYTLACAGNTVSGTPLSLGKPRLLH